MGLTPGALFAGRFRLVRRLGWGAFGDVHEAEEIPGGARVALKVLHLEMVDHPAQRERFEQESQITARFAHPNVVSVLASGVDARTARPWVAFELLVGETLAQRLEREPILAPACVATLFAQLGEGVGAAHQAGVIHADLKPENLFLAGPPERPTLKVLDFGISHLLKAGRTSTTVTSEMGSPAWTAPEQFTRGARLRASADVWAFGMLAFRMLTGRHYLLHAGEASTMFACIVEICATELPAASVRARALGVLDRLPADFDRWFQHCVAHAPDERFQHARAASAALRSLLAAPTLPPPAAGRADVLPSLWRTQSGAAHDPSAQPMSHVVAMLHQREFARVRRALDDATLPDASAEVWALRGECNMALGRYDDAVEDWSQAIVRASSVAPYLFGRSAAFEALGRPAAARADAALAALLSVQRR